MSVYPDRHPCCSAPSEGPHKFGCPVYGASRLTVPVVARDGRFRLALRGETAPAGPGAYLVVRHHEAGETTSITIVPEREGPKYGHFAPDGLGGGLTLRAAFVAAKRLAGWHREVPE